MKATSTLRPRASSPCPCTGRRRGPRPLDHVCPPSTIGFWLMQVFWLEHRTWSAGRCRRRSPCPCRARPGASTRTMMRAASTESTMPPRRQTTTAPESLTAMCSRPVPTSGASVRSSGTAWRCMLEPISARLASSFSRNGIERRGHGDQLLGARRRCSRPLRARPRRSRRRCGRMTRSSTMLPVVVELDVGLGDHVLLLFPGGQVEGVGLDLGRPLLAFCRPRRCSSLELVALDDLAELVAAVARLERPGSSRARGPFFTLRYGLSMKPYSLMRAKVESDEMRPMFGPSGVSIGQMRP